MKFKEETRQLFLYYRQLFFRVCSDTVSTFDRSMVRYSNFARAKFFQKTKMSRNDIIGHFVIFRNLKIVGRENRKKKRRRSRGVLGRKARDRYLDVHYVTHPCPTSAPAGCWSSMHAYTTHSCYHHLHPLVVTQRRKVTSSWQQKTRTRPLSSLLLVDAVPLAYVYYASLFIRVCIRANNSQLITLSNHTPPFRLDSLFVARPLCFYFDHSRAASPIADHNERPNNPYIR